MTVTPALARRLAAEATGTAVLVAVVAGSGIAAQQLSPGQTGLQLLENSTATVLGLAVVILLFGPVSGAHFNPVVSLADWLATRGTGRTGTDTAAYISAQTIGAVLGAVTANVMFDQPAGQISAHHRVTGGHLLSEIVATAGLVALIGALSRTGRTTLAPAAVPAWIGAAYWFTSSTSFANPAVTIGRIFTDTFAGIAPASAAAFIIAQLLGGLAGLALTAVCYPAPPAAPDGITVSGPAIVD
ncbi:aquaporin [Nocardia aurantia]|uniref:Aquaporin Z n=1 Tax=Nocardia aurantia TaxID=2585199 RepID=A0A7K0DNV4_9NOCA|nr:aquaporin [Nocardia aurantia]MQY27371.1 Aquaporin Z [Nocardia aurantia]